jgi:hypothetical protein
MTYKLSTKGNKLELSLTKNELVTEVDKLEYTVSLARTGGQGSKGDTISNVYVDANQHLIVQTVNSAGVTTTIDAGDVEAEINLDHLEDVIFNNLQNADYIAYDLPTQTFRNYQLTTSRMVDVNNDDRTDGSLLVFKETDNKYVATNVLNNPNTIITGGNF